MDQTSIDAPLVLQAAEEVAGEHIEQRASPLRGALAVGSVVLLMALGLGLAGLMARIDPFDASSAQPIWQQAIEAAPAEQAWQELATLWAELDAASIDTACDTPRAEVQNRTACLLVEGDWSAVSALNLPVVIQLAGPPVSHVLLVGLSDVEAIVQHRGQRHSVGLTRLNRLWTGRFFVVWPDDGSRLSPGESDPIISAVKELAAAQSSQPWQGDLNDTFDASFAQWLMAFQRRQGIASDGIIGPVTRLHLGYPQAQMGAPDSITQGTMER